MKQIQKLEVRINPIALTSILSFKNISGRFFNYKKDVYFFRYIGIKSEKTYMEEIMGLLSEVFIEKSLDNFIASNLVEKYSVIYEEWKNLSYHNIEKLIDLKFPFKFQDNCWEYTAKEAYRKIIEIYFNIKNQNESITKNFGIKLLYWIEKYFPKIFKNTEEIKNFSKVIYMGELKLQEYLFLYMLVLLGCDIVCLDSEKKKINIPENLLKLSSSYEEANSKKIDISIEDLLLKNTKNQVKINQAEESSNTIKVDLKRNELKQIIEQIKENETKEVSYEKLATLASSVVMISVFNRKKECIKTGSGVIINDKGNILTNFHVISNGYYFGVQLENDDKIYFTNEIVKYHDLNDLAIIKIEKAHKYIKLYQDTRELVRGQKVIAIGSPLGLFNSVSDGIISGFRMIDDLYMIQFTAPISHGSSGGALLDLNGKLIGIITAGFDKGQNINLAVEHKTILSFIKGFIIEKNNEGGRKWQ